MPQAFLSTIHWKGSALHQASATAMTSSLWPSCLLAAMRRGSAQTPSYTTSLNVNFTRVAARRGGPSHFSDLWSRDSRAMTEQ